MNNTYVYRRTNFFSFSSSQGSNDTNQESIPLVIFRQITISSEIVRPSLLLVILLINLASMWQQRREIFDSTKKKREFKT